MAKAKKKKKNIPVPPTPKASTPKKERLWLKYVYPVIIAIVFLISYPKVFDAKLDLNGDNFNYLALSDNILNGHGYSVLNVSGEYVPANWFPPGFPFILAFEKLIVGRDNINGLKMMNGLLYLISILLFYLIIIRLTNSPPLAFSVGILLALNSGLLRFATIIMSEIPFLLFSVLGLYAVVRLDSLSKEKPFWKTPWIYLTIVSVMISYYIRGFGIVFLAAFTLHWLFQKRWKLAGFFVAGSVLLFLPYKIRNSMYGLKGRYLKTVFVDNPWRPESGQITTFGDFVSKLITNLQDTILNGFPHVMIPSLERAPESIWITIFGVFVLLVAAFGIWRVKQYRILLGGVILFNAGIFLLWHTGNGVRYVWPLAGFIYFAFGNGLIELFRIFVFKDEESAVSKNLGFGILALSFFLFSSISFQSQVSKAPYNPGFRNYFSVAMSVAKLDNPESVVVACIKPAIFSHFSNSLATRFKYSTDDKEVIKHLLEIDADYVVLDQTGYGATGRYLYPAITKNQGLFTTALQLQNPDTYLLLFNKEAARAVLSQ